MAVNSKASGILVTVCLLLLLGNHYVINWENYTRKQAERNLYELIQDQRSDLIAWSNREAGSADFRKRTLCKGRLVEWSDDHPFEYNYRVDSISVLANEHGLFLFQTIDNGGCQFISGYPLYQTYAITNQYLKNGIGDRLNESIVGVSKDSGTYHLNQLVHYDIEATPNPLIDAIIATILIVILLIEYVRFANGGISSFLMATGSLITLRMLSLFFDALSFLFRYPLFDPINYTSSFFNPTLGDLLLNGILVLLVGVSLTKYFDAFKQKGWWISGSLGVGFALLLFHFPWSILANSQLSLDVGESIQFSPLRIAAYLSVIFVAVAFFVYAFHHQHYLRKTNKLLHIIISYAVVGVCLLPIKILLATPLFFYGMVLFISWKWKWGVSLGDFNYANLLYILLITIGIGTIFTFVTYKHAELAELDAKKKFGNYLLLKRDVLGEFYLDQSLKKLSNDSTISLIASEGSRADLEEKIRREFVSPYFNKYDLEIVFQDFQRLKVNTRFTREYALLTPENESDYENIYFIDEGTNFKYISKVNFGDLVGLIILQIKKRVPTTVYPALLTDSKYISISDDFDYAVFAGDEIMFHRTKFGQGEWPQQEDFEDEDLYEEGIEKNNRHYFGVRTMDGRTILIISNKYSTRDLLANFSFFFLLLLAACSLYSAIISTRNGGISFNFTSKIQLYLSMAFIVPLLATGFALLSTLNKSYREEIDRSYLKQALYISEILSDQLEERDDRIQPVLLTEIGNYLQSDISFYNESGYLIATSQPDIFSLDLQSNLINPIVFDQLIFRENQSLIAEESIGSLDYKVCYAVVSTTNSQVAGFIAMPFFDSRNHLNRQQIEVFGNLITIFGMIFIIAILVGNAVLNNLLFPLRMVAGKIRQVTLQDVNKPILYESSDEIGSLVKDYNHMLIKLEESKLALAKSQKETAWKEIARQVAHEIKNPLTPMRLKIQQLLRKYESESKDHEALSSLLTQVDTLSQIAESFSAFAEMPAPDNTVFDWQGLVLEVSRLYRSDDVTIELELEEHVFIEADIDIFRRILNNIVLNAIQSVEEEQVKLSIKLEKRHEKAVLSVTDNGKGVPDELRDKIFLNYFSTKSTGSGIGLALAKKGIENAGGNIWFESNQEKGTTFFISMPLAVDR